MGGVALRLPCIHAQTTLPVLPVRHEHDEYILYITRDSFSYMISIYVYNIVGFGIFTDDKTHFCPGDFILEYRGLFLHYEEALELEKSYPEGDCYMYYFSHPTGDYW